MKIKKISSIWIIVGVVVVLAIAAWLLSGNKKDTTINFTTEAVSLTNIENSVTATGTIEAVKTVTVGTQVSGIIDKLYVDYNSVVKKGQVIAELDKQNLQSQLNSSKATALTGTGKPPKRTKRPCLPKGQLPAQQDSIRQGTYLCQRL